MRRSPQTPSRKKAIGAELRRSEDLRFLAGRSQYTTDIKLPGTLHGAVLRSPHAHAKLRAIDVSAALACPGVIAVRTGETIKASVACEWVVPGMRLAPPHPALAQDRVRYVGQPVAFVVAESREAAFDALEHIRVQYERLPVVVGQEEARQDGAPVLHEGAERNEAFIFRAGRGDFEKAAAAADIHLKLRLTNNRLAPSPLEPRAVLSSFDQASGRLTHYTSTQLPHVHQRSLSEALGIPLNCIRLVAPDVGGGFGAKLHFYPEDILCAVLSIELARPVRWVEERTESFVATTHGRDQLQLVELAARKDGTITALKATILANLGAYPAQMGPGVPALNCGTRIAGPYRIPVVRSTVIGVYTNTTPVGPYRGAGHPEATYLIERSIETLARRLRLDPAEVRRRNFVTKFPHRHPTGATLDTGNYQANLSQALQAAGYDELRTEQSSLRQQGRYMGIGISTYVELSGAAPSLGMGVLGFRRGGHESACVRVHPDGGVTVYSGASAHGQGHETSLAQIAADALEVPVSAIRIVQGDTDQVPFGTGTFNSRSMAVGGSAVHEACLRIKAKANAIAAHLLQHRETDIVYHDGMFRVREGASLSRAAAHHLKQLRSAALGEVFHRLSGLPRPSEMIRRPADGQVSLAEVAAMAYLGHLLPRGVRAGLEETVFYNPKGMPAPFGTHLVVVEVDVETGNIELKRHIVVDDCGVMINPLLVRGQVHGGAAQGLGQALWEAVEYNADGVPKFGDGGGYAVPRFDMLPSFKVSHTMTPSKLNKLGVKGVGEGAAIGAPPAVVNAVLDALAPLGVEHLDMPLKPQVVWQAIRQAQDGLSTGKKPQTDAAEPMAASTAAGNGRTIDAPGII